MEGVFRIGPPSELVAILERMTYKPGYAYSVDANFLFHSIPVRDSSTWDDPNYIAPSAEMGWRLGQSVPLPDKCDDWTQFVFDALMRLETHEASEWFRVGGVAPYDPHALS